MCWGIAIRQKRRLTKRYLYATINCTYLCVLVYQTNNITYHRAFSFKCYQHLNNARGSFLYSFCTYILLQEIEREFVFPLIVHRTTIAVNIIFILMKNLLKNLVMMYKCSLNSISFLCIHIITFLYPCQYLFHHFHHFYILIEFCPYI